MLDTYIQHLQIAALEGFQEVSDSSLQASADEDAVTEVIEQDCSEGVNVTWSQRRDTVTSCSLRLSSLISLILNKTQLNSNSRCGVPWTWQRTHSSKETSLSRWALQKPHLWEQRGWNLLPVWADQSGQLPPSGTKRSCSNEMIQSRQEEESDLHFDWANMSFFLLEGSVFHQKLVHAWICWRDQDLH